jgi:hypothetical protein
LSAWRDLSQQCGDFPVVLACSFEIVAREGVVDLREQRTQLPQEAMPSA